MGGTCIAYFPTARDAAYSPIAYFELLSYCVEYFPKNCVFRPGKIDAGIALRNLEVFYVHVDSSTILQKFRMIVGRDENSHLFFRILISSL